MVQRHSRARLAIVAASLVLALAGIADAQGLPSLTVTALSLTSDRTSVPAGHAFHVTVHAHVAQRVSSLSWLVLPNLDNLTILGDEKRATPAPGDGTDYIETLTLAGIAPGDASLSPAYIDASDPSRGGRPFRFSSNALHIRITGEVATGFDPWRTYGPLVLRVAATLAIVTAVLLAFSFVVRRAALRRPPPPPPRPARVTVIPTPPPAKDGIALIRDARSALSATRTRADAAALRAALLEFAGARSDETLAALLLRIAPEQTALRAALRCAERATFVNESHLQGAIDELLDAVDRMSIRE